MGRYIDPDQRMSDEDKEFLRNRARADEVIENERRFPPNGEPAAHEEEGFMPLKEGYDYQKQAAKVEDAGGKMIEQIPVDEFGRPLTPEYGNTGEPEDDDDDEDTIDDDILEHVISLEYDDLQKELKELDLKANGSKEDLIDRLANGLQDKRDADNQSQE